MLYGNLPNQKARKWTATPLADCSVNVNIADATTTYVPIGDTHGMAKQEIHWGSGSAWQRVDLDVEYDVHPLEGGYCPLYRDSIETHSGNLDPFFGDAGESNCYSWIRHGSEFPSSHPIQGYIAARVWFEEAESDCYGYVFLSVRPWPIDAGPVECAYYNTDLEPPWGPEEFLANVGPGASMPIMIGEG